MTYVTPIPQPHGAERGSIVQVEPPLEPPTLSPRLARLLLAIVRAERGHQDATRSRRTLAA